MTTATRQRMRGYWSKWRELTEMFGDLCFYCHDEAATSIDHVLPYSYAVDNSIENLRPACALCNCLASNKMFDSVEAKTAYILDKRRNRAALRRATCTECGVPYTYRTHGPSLFLCAECYDLEYGTRHHDRASWQDWLALLDTAGIQIEIHRLAGRLFRDGRRNDPKWLRRCIITAMRQIEAREIELDAVGVREEQPVYAIAA